METPRGVASIGIIFSISTPLLAKLFCLFKMKCALHVLFYQKGKVIRPNLVGDGFRHKVLEIGHKHFQKKLHLDKAARLHMEYKITNPQA